MWDKISDDIVFTCGHCGRKVNPYSTYDFLGISPEEAFYMMPYCTCGHKEWENHC